MQTSFAACSLVLAAAGKFVSAQTTTTEPCAIVSASWAAQTAATATPTAEASLVYDCLQSVPINEDSALNFLNLMSPYIEWQSDTAFKKNPPADYFYPAYDIWGELDNIKAGLQNGSYANEYAWQSDLYLKVFGQAHDGHFVVYTDLLTNAVEWSRQWALVSVSEDGTSLPVIKLYDDIVSSPETASVVQLINGEDAVKYISDWIYQASSNQDADSAYNSMFFSKAYNQSGTKGYFSSGGRVRYVYPGNITTLTFENGTEVSLPNLGRLKGNWQGVTDGPSFFTHFCSGAAALATATATATGAATQATTTSTATSTSISTQAEGLLPGYPDPEVISSDSVVSGYFLDGEGFEDVAVLVLTSFDPDSPPEFQQKVQDFFELAVASGITKLVVDVQVNGGGYIFQGYDTFRQLFPDIVRNGTGRWRHSSGFAAVADVFSAACADFDPLTGDEELIEMCESVWNWRYDLDVSDNNFQSFDDKFGPVSFNSDEYTDVMQWNFSDPLSTDNTTFGIGFDVTGYLSRDNFSRPFGGPENIVLLLDGYCASTCTLFSQFLKWDAGVKSIAMGGRPQAGAIQGVGGVKGSQSFGFVNVLDEVQLAASRTSDPDLLAEFSRYDARVTSRAATLSLNVKDEILPSHLEDGTPAQFVAEYADCRLYWTEDMHKDITALWKAAATAAFNGGSCAFGGFNSTASAKRSTSRPAPFDKPRFTLPKKAPANTPEDVVKRATHTRSANKIMELQHMKVVD